jgi:hypothetical protein
MSVHCGFSYQLTIDLAFLSISPLILKEMLNHSI